MFSLTITEPRPNDLAWGRVTVCDFSERFEADLSYWSPDQYRQHWTEAVRLVVADEGPVAFVTSMRDPETANFIVWWPAWRDGDRVFVQNQLLFLDQLAEPFDEADPFRGLGSFGREGEDGDRISTWETTVREVEAFGGALARGAL